mgnify:CR=1 FL=1
MADLHGLKQRLDSANLNLNNIEVRSPRSRPPLPIPRCQQSVETQR